MKSIIGCAIVLGLLVCLARGCGSDDERLIRATQEADARQAEQNREMARLVADQQSIQKGIENEHERLDEQRTALDDERRAIAAARVRDPIIANALIGAVVLIVCALPLVLALVALRRAQSDESDDAALGELLVQELVADEPLLLPRLTAPSIEQKPVVADTASTAIARNDS
jgi:hypothetical protein